MLFRESRELSRRSNAWKMGEQEKRKENNKMVNRSHAELRYLETDDVLFGENRLLMGLFCLKRHWASWGIYSVGGSTCEDSWLRIRATLLKSDACGWLDGSINESENLMVLCNEWRDKRGKLRFHLYQPSWFRSLAHGRHARYLLSPCFQG